MESPQDSYNMPKGIHFSFALILTHENPLSPSGFFFVYPYCLFFYFCYSSECGYILIIKRVLNNMRTIKKLLLFGMIFACAFSVAACGKKKNKVKVSGVTSEESITEDNSLKLSDDEDELTEETTEEEPYREEKGTLYLKNVSLSIPSGYTLFNEENETVVYSTENGSSFAIHVENNNTNTREEIEFAYEEQIKSTYGEHVTSSMREINGHTYKIFDIDAPDKSFVGESAILVDGKTLIYFEFINLKPDESDFKKIIGTLNYK